MRKAPHSQSRTHLMRKTIFHKLRRGMRQVPWLHLSRRARVTEPWTNWQSDSEASIKAPAHWPNACRNATSTPQSRSEYDRSGQVHVFTSCWGLEVKDDLDRVTPQSQEGLGTEIKQNKQRCSRTVMLKVNLCRRSEESSEKSVPTETPVPQSSAGIPEQAIEDDLRKQLELSVPHCSPGEWKYEFKMSMFTTTILNLLYAEAEKMDKFGIFRMYIGPGSDGSSADKVSTDLEFNPWDTAFTFRPDWRSLSKTVFT